MTPTGAPTRRVLVYFHGLSNSPQSFVALAERFVAQGDAVLIPRLPRHGYADRLTPALAGLTAEALVDAAAEVVDLAAGLADEVLVAGISLGGVLAGLVASTAPWRWPWLSLLPSASRRPRPAQPGLDRGGLALPNRFLVGPALPGALPGPPYAYPATPATPWPGAAPRLRHRRGPPGAPHGRGDVGRHKRGRPGRQQR